ncbi:MAG: hypothetical protein ACR2NR_18405 [Solirubrobacteraceae bacterium]
MTHALGTPITFFRRRTIVAAIVALVASAAVATSTSAHQTLVRAHVARDGSIVVSGYDGGAPLAPTVKP